MAQFFEQLAQGELDGRPDAWTFAAIVLACRAGEQWALVLRFYGEMRALHMPIYIDVFYAVLESCERQGLWKEGRDVLQDMRVRTQQETCKPTCTIPGDDMRHPLHFLPQTLACWRHAVVDFVLTLVFLNVSRHLWRAIAWTGS